MPNFYNYNSLFKYINNQLKFSIQEVGKLIKEEVKKYIQNNLYDTYTPLYYQRTMNYLESITVSKVNSNSKGYVVEIYFDTSKIIPNYTDTKYNQHMDVYGTPKNNYIPLWLEEGTENNNGNFFPREGIHAMGNVAEWIDYTEFHINKLIQILKMKGFDCTFK